MVYTKPYKVVLKFMLKSTFSPLWMYVSLYANRDDNNSLCAIKRLAEIQLIALGDNPQKNEKDALMQMSNSETSFFIFILFHPWQVI